MDQGGRSRIIDITPTPRARGPLIAAGGIVIVGGAVCGVVWIVALSLWQDEKAAAQCRSDQSAFEAVQDHIISESYAGSTATVPPYGHSGMQVVRVRGRACTFQVESHVSLIGPAGERYLEPLTARATFDKAERRWLVTSY